MRVELTIYITPWNKIRELTRVKSVLFRCFSSFFILQLDPGWEHIPGDYQGI